MRAASLILASILAVVTVACSPKQPAAPPAPPAPAAAPAPTPSPAPSAAAQAPLGPAGSDAGPPGPEAPQGVAAPAAPAIVHFSPGDYPAKERRISALINNAESRDTSGETQYLAGQARAQRARCTTKACIDGSYAAEEARLRKWEGSSDIK